MKILSATDLSPCSRVAARLARAIARRRGDTLCLIHCTDTLPIEVPGSAISQR